ncbi:negative elongation factor A-like [Papilio machaon]|uniref:negative elongation factor A-like n=1 Tax=Papilio machaon TaxID=76193 RepID=UPI001E663BDF|nr:negative elongation factor A-like [Papilio machaon]
MSSTGQSAPPDVPAVPTAQPAMPAAHPELPAVSTAQLAMPAAHPELPAVSTAQPTMPAAHPELPAVSTAQLAMPAAHLELPAVSTAQPDTPPAQFLVPAAQPEVFAVNPVQAAAPLAQFAVPEALPEVLSPEQPAEPTAEPNVPEAQAAEPAAPRSGYWLTRELMRQARIMFHNANCVTPPEKHFILCFMAGFREHPNPTFGHIVTIKLAEFKENVKQSEDTYITMLAEIHIQLNYANGQWLRFKKYRPLAGAVPQKIQEDSVVASNQNGSSN